MAEITQEPEIICRPCALSVEERDQSRMLRAELAVARQATVKLPNGCAFQFGESAEMFVKAAMWVALERRCCPFLTFELRWQQGDHVGPWLAVTGPEGTSEFLASEVPELRTNG